MIIVHIITRLLRAGSEENTIATCIAQARAGHRVLLVHGREADPRSVAECAPYVEVVGVPELIHELDLLQDIRATRALKKLFASLQPTFVHTHQSKDSLILFVSCPTAGAGFWE